MTCARAASATKIARVWTCGPGAWRTTAPSRSADRHSNTFIAPSLRAVSAGKPCDLAYGLAESTLLVTSGPEDGPVFVDTPDGRSLVSSGVIDDGHAIRIVDPESRVAVADGDIGEIWVNSPSVASGYWHKPEDTAQVFGAVISDSGDGPYLRTGDLGCIVDGRLFVTGRIKDVLIVRGVKHYPQDLEATAEQAHSAVRPGCCVAFAVDRDGEECIALVAETDPARSESDGELQQAIASVRRSVAERHQVSPCAVAIVPAGSLPKTTSGKLQRFLCRAAFRAGEFQLLAFWSDSLTVVQPFRAVYPPHDRTTRIHHHRRRRTLLAVGRANRPGDAIRPAGARLAGDDRTCRGVGGGARLRSAGRRVRRLHGREDAGCASDARRHRCARARGSLRSDVRRCRPAGGRSSIQTDRTNDGSPLRAKDPAHRWDGISRSGADSGTSRDDVGDLGVSGEAEVRPAKAGLYASRWGPA